MKKLLGILVLSLFFSSTAYAEWTRISKTTLGDTYYVDFENIKIVFSFSTFFSYP